MTTVAALYIDPKGPYPRMARGEAFRVLGPHGEPYCREWGPEREIDCWDASRDARLYDGPHPVIAHPPCKHWGRLRHLAKVECGGCKWRGREAQLGHAPGIGPYCPLCACDYIVSAADCAPRAVEQVRRWGGVLEHPAQSKLWEACELPLPIRTYVGCDGGCMSGFLVGGQSVGEDGSLPADAFGGYTIEIDQVEWGHVARKRTWLYLVGVPREALEAPPFPGREPIRSISGRRGRATQEKHPNWKEQLPRCSDTERRRTPPLFAEYLIRLARSARP